MNDPFGEVIPSPVIKTPEDAPMTILLKNMGYDRNT